MANLVKSNIKLANAGLDENQIKQLLNQEQISEEMINDLCIILEKVNYKFIKKHNEKGQLL
jgi:hypothetical protein